MARAVEPVTQSPPQPRVGTSTAPQQLSVLGTGRRSLFDRVRPAEIAAVGRKLRGPGGMALAGLRSTGVTGGTLRTADDVIVGGRAFGTPRPAWFAATEGAAIGQAYGIATVREQRGIGGHSWCIVRSRALRLGPALEAITAIGDLDPVGLILIVVGPSQTEERTVALLEACRVTVSTADNNDAWSVVSALDHAARRSRSTATAVVATRDGA